MSEQNTQDNRAVWFDIPVADLDRAIAFYKAVLDIDVVKESFEGVPFAVLEHGRGVGGCLIVNPAEVSTNHGILLYMNVDGRIKDAVAKTIANDGQLVEVIHAIGPHGFRAIVLDSEGNRLALHSQTAK